MLYLIYKVCKIFDIQNIFYVKLLSIKVALLVNCVNKTNCHSPSLPHSFIPSLPLNIVLSIFPSSHPFLFQLLSSLPSLFFLSPALFFPFPFILSLLTLSFSHVPSLFLSLFPSPTLAFLLTLSLSVLSSLSCHHIFSLSLFLLNPLSIFPLSLFKNC